MGLVRAAYSAGKPAYGVGPGNAPSLHRAHRRRPQGGARRRHRQDVRQRRPLLVAELRRRRRPGGRRGQARVREERRLLPVDRRRATRSRTCCSARSGCRIPKLVGRPATVIAQAAGITVPADTRVLIAELKGVGRDYPLSIEKLSPGPLLLRRRRLEGRLRALHRDPALRRHGPHDVDPLAQRPGHPGVRPEEAGRPHRRQHADDARIDRADDGAGSGDDAGLRRLGRQHHVRQHLAAASAQHQAARVRDHAGRRAAGRRRPTAARERACRRPLAAAAQLRRPFRAGSPPTSSRAGSTSSWLAGLPARAGTASACRRPPAPLAPAPAAPAHL